MKNSTFFEARPQITAVFYGALTPKMSSYILLLLLFSETKIPTALHTHGIRLPCAWTIKSMGATARKKIGSKTYTVGPNVFGFLKPVFRFLVKDCHWGWNLTGSQFNESMKIPSVIKYLVHNYWIGFLYFMITLETTNMRNILSRFWEFGFKMYL